MGSLERAGRRAASRKHNDGVNTRKWVFHSASCTFWTDRPIDLTLFRDVPACPQCLCPMLQIEQRVWWDNVRVYAREHNLVYYEDLIRWLRKRCYRNLDEALVAWNGERAREASLKLGHIEGSGGTP